MRLFSVLSVFASRIRVCSWLHALGMVASSWQIGVFCSHMMSLLVSGNCLCSEARAV